jgi:hypothetical protein
MPLTLMKTVMIAAWMALVPLSTRRIGLAGTSMELRDTELVCTHGYSITHGTKSS